MPASGGMTGRVRFECRGEVDDGYGNPVSGVWTHQFAEPAEIVERTGGEVNRGARLQGTRTVTITVRASGRTRQVTNDWRVIDDRSRVVYAVKTLYETPGRDFIVLDCTSGETP